MSDLFSLRLLVQNLEHEIKEIYKIKHAIEENIRMSFDDMIHIQYCSRGRPNGCMACEDIANKIMVKRKKQNDYCRNEINKIIDRKKIIESKIDKIERGVGHG